MALPLLAIITSGCSGGGDGDTLPTTVPKAPDVTVSTGAVTIFSGSVPAVHVGAGDPIALTVPLADGTIKQYLVNRDAAGQPVRLAALRRFSAADPSQFDEARFSPEGRPTDVRLASGAQVQLRYVGDRVLLAVTMPDGQTATTTFTANPAAITPAVRVPASVDASVVVLPSAGTVVPSVRREAGASVSAAPARGAIVVTGPDGPVNDAIVTVEFRKFGPAFDFYRPAATSADGAGRYAFSMPVGLTAFDGSPLASACDVAAKYTKDPCLYINGVLKTEGGPTFLASLILACNSLLAPPAVAACLASAATLSQVCNIEDYCSLAKTIFDWALPGETARTLRAFVRRGKCVQLVSTWDVSNVVSGATLSTKAVTTSCPPPAVSIMVALSGTATAASESTTPLVLAAVAATDGMPQLPVGTLTITGPTSVVSCTQSGIGTLTVAMLTCEAPVPKTVGTATYTAVAQVPAVGGYALATATVNVTPALDSIAIYQQAVLGTWFVGGYDNGVPPANPYRLEIRAGGRGAYVLPSVKDGNGNIVCSGTPSPPLASGFCEYGMSWSIRRANGRYYLDDIGFWNSGVNFERRDPLTMPVTGFKTYSNFVANTLSRLFSR